MSLQIQPRGHGMRRRQHGAVLVVSLILLLVMTILAVSGSQMVRMQERMAGNIRDTDLAFQAAEAALRDSEQYIEDLTMWPVACDALAAGCEMYEPQALIDEDLRLSNQTFWNTYGRDYRTAAREITEVVEDPRYVIERLGDICDTAEGGGACMEWDTVYYFRTTARARGGTATADARVQTTYAKRGG